MRHHSRPSSFGHSAVGSAAVIGHSVCEAASLFGRCNQLSFKQRLSRYPDRSVGLPAYRHQPVPLRPDVLQRQGHPPHQRQGSGQAAPVSRLNCQHVLLPSRTDSKGGTGSTALQCRNVAELVPRRFRDRRARHGGAIEPINCARWQMLTLEASPKSKRSARSLLSIHCLQTVQRASR